jgi:hypothetical protein
VAPAEQEIMAAGEAAISAYPHCVDFVEKLLSCA